MPKFNIPVVTRPLKLSDYAPEFGDAVVQVWVNPPRKYLNRYDEMIKTIQGTLIALKDNPANPDAGEALKQNNLDFMQWYSEIWSAGPEDTRWTLDEVKTLVESGNDTDPALWGWLEKKTIQMIGDYKAGQKKI